LLTSRGKKVSPCLFTRKKKKGGALVPGDDGKGAVMHSFAGRKEKKNSLAGRGGNTLKIRRREKEKRVDSLSGKGERRERDLFAQAPGKEEGRGTSSPA